MVFPISQLNSLLGIGIYLSYKRGVKTESWLYNHYIIFRKSDISSINLSVDSSK